MLSLTRDLLRKTKDPAGMSAEASQQPAIRPLTVCFWSEFMDNPSIMYGLFSAHPRKLNYDPDRVKVMGTKDGMINQINISSVEDLESFQEQIVGVPMLLRIWVVHTTNDYVGAAPTHQQQFEGDLALLVDTSHPMIRPQLELALDEAKKVLQARRHFCVQIDFGGAIDNWLKSVNRGGGICSACHLHHHQACLYITNYAKPQHCLDCSPLWCLLLGPCWLLSAPCYKLFRFIKCRDIVVHVDAPIVRRAVLAISGKIVEVTR